MDNEEIRDLQIKILQNQELSTDDLERLENCPEAIEFKEIVDSLGSNLPEIDPPVSLDESIKSFAREQHTVSKPLLSFRFMAIAATLLLAFILVAVTNMNPDSSTDVDDKNLVDKKPRNLKLEPAQKAAEKEFQVSNDIESVLDSNFGNELDLIESELDRIDMNNQMEDYLVFAE